MQHTMVDGLDLRTQEKYVAEQKRKSKKQRKMKNMKSEKGATRCRTLVVVKEE